MASIQPRTDPQPGAARCPRPPVGMDGRRLRRLAGRNRRRPPCAHWRGQPWHRGVLPRARRDLEAADRGEGLRRDRGRGRLARRLPHQPLRPPYQRRRHPAGGAGQLRALPAVDVAQHDGPRRHPLAAGVQRGAPWSAGGVLRARSLQPERVDPRGDRLPGHRRPRRGEPRAASLQLLRPLRRRFTSLWPRGELRPDRKL